MFQVSRPLYRATVLAAVVAAVFVVGCHKTPKNVGPSNTAPPPPAAAEPTVTLQADPTSINPGDSSTLSWTSNNATQVTVSPEIGTVTAQGSAKVTPTQSTTYTITASGPGGSGTASARVTVSAAVAPTEPPPSESDDAIWNREVQDAYFDFNKADIRSDARAALAKTAEYLRNNPQIRVTIEGHCDERGSTEYNLALGDRRANAAKQYLVSLGLSADRLSSVSFGKEKPFCSATTEECYQQNRRAHFVRAR
ncbi:MAG TPA: peptidoglycan-associated lipoprotein Pal [Candidatus Acidoferrum sp.]|jgi:peptidoglycan-associated lipoprotein